MSKRRRMQTVTTLPELPRFPPEPFFMILKFERMIVVRLLPEPCFMILQLIKDKGGQMNSTAWYPGHPGRGVFNDAAVSQSVPTVVILIDLSPSSQNSQTRRWNFFKSHLYAFPLWSWIVLLDCFFKWSGNAKRAQILRVEVTWDGNHLEKIIFTVLRWPEMGTHWVLAIVICIVCKMFCLFRCASISCFQVVSESVSQ